MTKVNNPILINPNDYANLVGNFFIFNFYIPNLENYDINSMYILPIPTQPNSSATLANTRWNRNNLLSIRLKNIVFKLELDTSAVISGSNPDYKAVESKYASSEDQGLWEYYNGSSWETIPLEGVYAPIYTGNPARLILNKNHTNMFPNKNQSWHWRILGSNNIE